jgi:hypothetical protein
MGALQIGKLWGAAAKLLHFYTLIQISTNKGESM